MNENRLKGLFESLKPKEEHKDTLFQALSAKGEQAEKRMPIPWRHVRTAMLATAMMIGFITTTAYAAAYFGLDMKFLNFLKPSDSEQERYLQNGAYVVNKQVANKNGTLEIKQIIGDGHLIYILMDFTAPEGTVLNAERYRFEGDLDWDSAGSSSAGYDFALLDDGNSEDNKISLVMSYLVTDQTAPGQEVTLLVENLEGAEAFPDEYETVISGSWETRLKLDYKNISTQHRVDKKLTLYGYEATWSSISVSPISVTLKVSSTFTKQISEAASESWKEIGLNEYSDHYPMIIRYQDGTSETTSVFTGMVVADHLSETITIVKTFTPLINDKQIETIEFFGTVIPMN
ncbi:hypothetical protein DFP94_101142 [Fontibacillus phaseoli]|uniref:DUF4179 domain-containing protein n=1 Tax=Fontibacillus phaseoli TaxID=1416533 RepID=A0A369BLT8_9BACL|nr:DUF4179 domain-containing protein [Fontibacillus phaseoli]RCX22562.1 hypothetical protein DFP94_101142 [Fontibacillus phaseoli]